MQRIPLGAATSPHAVRRARWPVRAYRSPSLPLVVAIAGVLAGLIGLLLYQATPVVSVSADAAGYHVGGEDLVAQGDGSFVSPSGTALVETRSGDRITAGGSAHLDGEAATGRCDEVAGSGTETCTFTIGGASLRAADTRSGSGWSRRYSDGETVSIRIAGDPDTPVPFPVGR